MYAHSMFHEKKNLPDAEKMHLLLLHIAEKETDDFLQIRQDLEEALLSTNTKGGLKKFAEKIERAMVSKKHDIRLKVKVAILLDEFTKILAAKGLETKGIAKLSWNDMHDFLREQIVIPIPYKQRVSMTLAALISLEGTI